MAQEEKSDLYSNNYWLLYCCRNSRDMRESFYKESGEAMLCAYQRQGLEVSAGLLVVQIFGTAIGMFIFRILVMLE